MFYINFLQLFKQVLLFFKFPLYRELLSVRASSSELYSLNVLNKLYTVDYKNVKF